MANDIWHLTIGGSPIGVRSTSCPTPLDMALDGLNPTRDLRSKLTAAAFGESAYLSLACRCASKESAAFVIVRDEEFGEAGRHP